VFGGDGWGWWPPKLPVFVEHDDLASMRNCIHPEVRFRALLSQDETRQLEVVRA
jgi:hypothetical protein